jgi:hypothetical protein
LAQVSHILYEIITCLSPTTVFGGHFYLCIPLVWRLSVAATNSICGNLYLQRIPR